LKVGIAAAVVISRWTTSDRPHVKQPSTPPRDLHRPFRLLRDEPSHRRRWSLPDAGAIGAAPWCRRRL